MAKRKVPAALFEVIHTAPPPPLKFSKPRRSWWFGPRGESASAEMLRSAHPSMIPDEPAPAARERDVAAAVARSPEAELRARFAEAAAHEVAVFSADEPEGLEMEDEPRTGARPAAQSPLTPLPRTNDYSLGVSEYCAGGLRIDRDRQELTFRLRYTTAALAAFIALVIVGLAFVVGKRIADRGGDDQAMAALRASQPSPGVMNVDRSDPSAGAQLAHSESQGAASAASHESQADPMAVGPAAAAAGPAQRTIGLDYLVVQSYPDRKSAQDAADMLTAGGVGCTVEHGLRWAPNWYSVVTVAGYPPHSAEGDRLAESIQKIASAQARLGHHYRFKPQGYQWNQ